MERTPVTSSNLTSVGFEIGTLEVEFRNNHVYQYFDVPEVVYKGLMDAESHGKHFDANIKKAGYSYKKIR